MRIPYQSSNPRTHRMALCTALLAALGTSAALAAAPTSWNSVGVGGGGALFQASFSPHDTDDLFITCDMGEVFRTTDFGQSWETLHFTELQGGRYACVSFTSSAQTLYAIDEYEDAGLEGQRPTKSTDGGATWTPIAADPTGSEAYYLFADDTTTTRLIVADYTTLYFSNDGGTSFTNEFTHNPGGAGLHIAGAFWDGTNIYVGTNAGLLVSTNGGTSFAVDGTTGIAAGENIVRFFGAKEGGTVRLWALTSQEGLYGGIQPEDFFWEPSDVYTLDVGAGSWQLRRTGLPTANGNGFPFIAGPRNDIDTAWVAGADDGGVPSVFRTTNAGTSWASVLDTVDNDNIVTGWSGDGGDRGWGYGEYALGFAVAPTDGNVAAFTDLGFCHVTNNGGTTWRQAYVDPSTENPAGIDTPQRQYYQGIGLEDTTVWNLTWFDANRIWACFTDIRGIRSEDGGATWGFDYSGHTENSSYDVVIQDGTGHGFMATSTVHDMYQTTYLTDAQIDGGDGRVLRSTDGGETWVLMEDFNHPVFDLEFDPNDANTLYACVVHSTAGGIFRTTDINLGAGATWTQLTNPPRTQGHPYSIKVLDDGSLVCTYSGRRASSQFTDSSGVFYSTNGGTSWNDVSSTAMHYYVKDLVIDPHDATQNTWYVGVWSGYGTNPNGSYQLQTAGGLYRTTNRGTSWTRIFAAHRVTSCAVHPTWPNEAFATTETQGLWHTTNLSAGSPTFTQQMGYPFSQPERVAFNPFDATQVWVMSFGNGLYVGTSSPLPVELDGFAIE